MVCGWTVWKATNVENTTWDPTVYGNAMLYHFCQKDPGNVYQHDISGSHNGMNITTQITATDGDDEMAPSISTV